MDKEQLISALAEIGLKEQLSEYAGMRIMSEINENPLISEEVKGQVSEEMQKLHVILDDFLVLFMQS